MVPAGLAATEAGGACFMAPSWALAGMMATAVRKIASFIFISP
jgi:hypothetical protein